jgi:hypothetical protein
MSVTSAMAAKLLWVEMELLELSCWIFCLDVSLFDGLDHSLAGALVLVMTQDRVSFVGLSLEYVAVSDHLPIETVAGWLGVIALENDRFCADDMMEAILDSKESPLECSSSASARNSNCCLRSWWDVGSRFSLLSSEQPTNVVQNCNSMCMCLSANFVGCCFSI